MKTSMLLRCAIALLPELAACSASALGEDGGADVARADAPHPTPGNDAATPADAPAPTDVRPTCSLTGRWNFQTRTICSDCPDYQGDFRTLTLTESGGTLTGTLGTSPLMNGNVGGGMVGFFWNGGYDGFSGTVGPDCNTMEGSYFSEAMAYAGLRGTGRAFRECTSDAGPCGDAGP